MLDLQQGAASPDDVRDALGELANMVGGNIKGLLPGPTQLSLPLVVEGGKDALRILDTQPVSTVWFSSGGHPFVVTLLRRVKS
jgi:chemotaxis protein CheX